MKSVLKFPQTARKIAGPKPIAEASILRLADYRIRPPLLTVAVGPPSPHRLEFRGDVR